MRSLLVSRCEDGKWRIMDMNHKLLIPLYFDSRDDAEMSIAYSNLRRSYAAQPTEDRQ